MDRRYRDLKTLARRYGYDVDYSGGKGHGRLICRSGDRPTITVAGSPKNVDHWLRSIERDLKKAVDTSQHLTQDDHAN